MTAIIFQSQGAGFETLATHRVDQAIAASSCQWPTFVEVTGRLSGKVALVTGGASGIGLATVRRFVAEGAQVVIGDIDEASLAAVAGELGEACATAIADVTSEDDVAELVALAIERFGRLDIAVANAGSGHFSLLVDHELSDWQRVIELCLTGVFLTIKHAGRHISDGGSIITVASLNAAQPAQGMSAYCAAKAAVAMLTKVAAMELGHRQVRVNAIAPGLVKTALTQIFWDTPGLVDEFAENTTVGRFGTPAEVASLAVFLSSDESAFVSGSFYAVDGGASTKRYPDLPAAFAHFTA
jgi:NAD(P)-dependent dehydrogenase (short-subunit alcohol dehydrogenase family)